LALATTALLIADALHFLLPHQPKPGQLTDRQVHDVAQPTPHSGTPGSKVAVPSVLSEIPVIQQHVVQAAGFGAHSQFVIQINVEGSQADAYGAFLAVQKSYPILATTVPEVREVENGPGRHSWLIVHSAGDVSYLCSPFVAAGSTECFVERY
jgi:hypothetical protein